ncbi:MAG: ATP-dependent DNA helicase RecG [Flavobacteriales bacterium]|nr:ATP-dependent DNA helicase RecG [Flavobacteriales bacterium]
MSENILDTPVEFLKGVGPVRADLLTKELGIRNFRRLLFHLPFRYVDRSQFHQVSDIVSDTGFVQLKGEFTKVQEIGVGRKMRLSAVFEDESGRIECVWFKGAKWIKPKIHYGETYILYGKPSRYKNTWNITHPDFESMDARRGRPEQPLQPVYSSTEKLSGKGLHTNGLMKLIQNLLPQVNGDVPETLPQWLIDKMKFPAREKAILGLHAPTDLKSIEAFRTRLKFEELFFLQLVLLLKKNQQTIELPGVRFERVGEKFNQFYAEKLPFELTNAQKRVIKEIRGDVNTGRHMSRLLQGDVGSGKTIVALICALIAIDNGFQVALMAPTEILATQHMESFTKMLEGMDVNVALLTGSVKTAARKEIHSALEDGSLDILIGTHALIEPKVKFQNLGLAIVDEQHRFGVAQRAKLWKKAALAPHVLVMTATPIPRTLAMTVYGDLDVSTIDELPPGRKEIRTVHRFDKSRLKVFQFIRDEIAKGRQIYVVYPLIEESQAMDYKDLMDGYESVTRAFPAPNYRVSIVHGKMKPEDKDFEMRQFAEGKSQILVATTVIEVGVNVPNASVMVIESSERFGLSQLHQLRGRVGRGAEQSYCILMTGEKLSNDARTRLETMCRTNDGFEIAEVDLDLRGPGDLMGTQQSGDLPLDLADLVKDKQLLVTARHIAEQVLEEDPHLDADQNRLLKEGVKRIRRGKQDWSRIS